MINAVEQGLPRAAAEQYIKSPRKYHGGEYLGRDLAVRETVNPVRLFIGGYIAFFVLREYSTATGDDVGRILAAIVFGAAPFFTEKFIFRRRPDIMANNYPA